MRGAGLLLGILILLGCEPSTTQTAGGSAVEGETVAARILDARGNPLSHARVAIRSTDPPGWSLDAVTDSQGGLALNVPRGIREIVLTLTDPSDPIRTLTFRIAIRPGLDTTLVAPRWGAMAGSIRTPPGWEPAFIVVEGLDLSAEVLDDGSYRFEHIPPGTWPFVLLADSSGTSRRFDLGEAPISLGGSDLVWDFEVRTNRSVLADFETDSLPVVCLRADRSLHEPAASCAQTASGDAAWSGTSLRIHLAGTPESAAARIATQRPGSPSGSLRPTDTLSFMARGTGLFRISLEVRRTPEILAPGPPIEILATSEWHLHRILMSELLPDPSDPSSPFQPAGVVVSSEEETWLVLDEVLLLRAEP